MPWGAAIGSDDSALIRRSPESSIYSTKPVSQANADGNGQPIAAALWDARTLKTCVNFISLFLFFSVFWFFFLIFMFLMVEI
ncbi:hypothetical protein [Symbiopectobacterium purcellii]|uniref:hypothetical protein n=1 Tax=Symbiopectobacterium purcellii TaxID=2871826 RepID=UPI003F830690